MKFRSLLATLAVVFSLLFAACEVPSGIILGEDDVTFDITISNVTSSGATVNVVPSDKTTLYYFDKIAKSAYASYKNEDDFKKDMIENLRSYVSSSGGALFSALSVGEAEHTYSNELSPSTDYYIFAFTIDAKLNPTSKLALKEFTTEAVKMSNNTFSISVNGGVITVTPSNNDTYFWSVEPSDIYEGQNDDYIMNDLIQYYDGEGYLEYYLASGVSSFDYSTLLSVGESYTVYAFGYEGSPTTALTEYTFTYGSGSGSGDYATTTLTGDVTMNIVEIQAYDYDDYYEIGTRNWEIGFYNKVGAGYECVAIESFTALSTTTPEGNYVISAVAGDPNTAFSGDFDEEGYILPAYYIKKSDSDEIQDFALIMSGSFSIEKSGSGYKSILNFADELGNKITGSYTGPITIAKGEVGGYAAQASVGNRANRSAARSALRRFSSAALIQPAATAPSRVMRTK